MFNFFKSKPKIAFTDRIWTDSRQKIDGICREVADAAATGKVVMVIAFFDEALRTIEAEMRSRGIAFQTKASPEGGAFSGASSPGDSSKVWLLSASQIEPGGGSEPVGGRPDLYAILVEHHPLLSRDRAVLESIAGLPFGVRITCHTALDEPFMNRFGGDKIRSLMTALGQAEGVALEHPMISASIERAQEKLEKRVTNEIEASSAEEWFRSNIG
jgi:hypothetical protein